MRYILIYLISLLFLCSCGKKTALSKKEVSLEETREIKTHSFKSFEAAYLNTNTEKIRVINFWATWCRPCVKELPYFEELTLNNKEVEVILVSLDLSTQKDTKLIPFVKEHQLKSKVVHLDEPDADSWIPKVDKDWSGAIPATLIINKNKQQFYEQSFNYSQLVEAINTFKNEK